MILLSMKLSKVYQPSEHESDIYKLWLDSGAFKPKQGNGEPYSIVMPPPNANGDLHTGHALMLAIEDIAIRYQRMQGRETLWLPGADHAGFETQVVYEKKLAKAGKSRFDFTREELYKQIWNFVAQNRQTFEDQFRRIGVSADWDRFTYTLDEKIIKTAYQTFKKMWDEGLIYRGERLVNYCTHHRTGFSDIEVEYKDVKTPLYYMKYGPFELATTRLETKFGDTAVAVHPSDKRYKKWVGQTVTVEGVNGPFEVRVIADEMVDPKFGTGVVKITPAHSFDDWEVARRHNLQPVRVIDHDGTMNHKAGRFAGMTVMEARQAVATALEEKGLLIKVDSTYKTRVGHCYKCGTVIEPMLMEQWFIDMRPLATNAITALKNKQITFYPDSKRVQLIGYLEDLHDWNISRQIAWGIPIPAFQNVDDSDDWIYDERVTEETIEIDGKTYRRDPDVFDTWFSSGSWPYATMNYPDGEDFKRFYPNSLMETGADILYPWVSRMIMMGLYSTGKIPFKSVYLHGLIQDEHGQKMSKSKGNVINPMKIVNQYGSDAFRMGIVASEAPGNNRPFDISKTVAARNFCNKLWNIARFIGSKTVSMDSAAKPTPKAVADFWILSKLQHSERRIREALDEYRFAEAYDELYHLVWDDFADWYIEASKVEPNNSVLAYGLATILKLAHPFAPFVTETIWQSLGCGDAKTPLVASLWPEIPETSATQAKQFESLKILTEEVRFVQAVLGERKLKLLHDNLPLLNEHANLVKSLSGLQTVTTGRAGQGGIRLGSSGLNCWLDVAEATAKKFQAALLEKLEEQGRVVKQLKARLSNKSYVQNAPKQIVDQTKSQLTEAQQLLGTLEQDIKSFG